MDFEIDLESADHVAFIGDLHLKTWWSSDLRVTGDSQAGLQEILRVIRESKAKVLILAGDIWDANVLRDADLVVIYRAFIDRLISNGVQVLAFHGNHDAVNAVDDFSSQWLEVHKAVRNIDGKTFRLGDRICHAVGFRDSMGDLHEHLRGLPAKVNTLFVHQNLKGCKYPTFNMDEDEVPATVREIYCGDIHEFKSGKNRHGALWTYSGAMFPQDVSQHEHSVIVLPPKPQWNDGEHSFGDGYPFRREEIAARRVISLHLQEPGSAFVDHARRAVAEVKEGFGDAPYLSLISTPVVVVRVEPQLKHAIGEVREALSQISHLLIKVLPADVLNAVIPDADDLDSLPTPAELVDKMVTSMQEHDAMDSRVTHPEKSVQLVKELLDAVGDQKTRKGRYAGVIQATLRREDGEAEPVPGGSGTQQSVE